MDAENMIAAQGQEVTPETRKAHDDARAVASSRRERIKVGRHVLANLMSQWSALAKSSSNEEQTEPVNAEDGQLSQSQEASHQTPMEQREHMYPCTLSAVTSLDEGNMEFESCELQSTVPSPQGNVTMAFYTNAEKMNLRLGSAIISLERTDVNGRGEVTDRSADFSKLMDLVFEGVQLRFFFGDVGATSRS